MVHLEVAAWFAQDNLKVIHLHPLERIISVTNSSSGLIFVKIRAESRQIFSKNPDKTKIL